MPTLPGPSFGNSGFESMFSLVFFVIVGVIVFGIVRSIGTWAMNQSSPVQQRAARVVAKRNHVWGGGGDFHTHTTYYATFEFVDDGSRLEFSVPDREFGLLAEGDVGTLNYQGSQYNHFERAPAEAEDPLARFRP